MKTIRARVTGGPNKLGIDELCVDILRTPSWFGLLRPRRLRLSYKVIHARKEDDAAILDRNDPKDTVKLMALMRDGHDVIEFLEDQCRGPYHVLSTHIAMSGYLLSDGVVIKFADAADHMACVLRFGESDYNFPGSLLHG